VELPQRRMAFGEVSNLVGFAEFEWGRASCLSLKRKGTRRPDIAEGGVRRHSRHACMPPPKRQKLLPAAKNGTKFSKYKTFTQWGHISHRLTAKVAITLSFMGIRYRNGIIHSSRYLHARVELFSAGSIRLYLDRHLPVPAPIMDSIP
jgi:hypothetical protein